MVPQSGERFNRFLQAQKRTRDDGAEERYCTICQTWDGRKQSAWYKHHGLGKCTPPANPLSPEDPEDAWDASGGVYEGMYADGAEGSGTGRGWVFSNKQGRIESIKLTPKQILQDRSKCCKSKRRFEKCVR